MKEIAFRIRMAKRRVSEMHYYSLRTSNQQDDEDLKSIGRQEIPKSLMYLLYTKLVKYEREGKSVSLVIS
jgi:hypothetical protein